MGGSSRSYQWVWFFVALLALGLLAVAIQIRHNMGQQVKPEQLAAARALWEEKGPKSYRLQYIQKVNASDVNEVFVVWVRHGRVQALVKKQRADQADAEGTLLESRLNDYYSMPALFDHIGRYLEMNVRTFMVASFDPNDGHVLRFVRRVAGTSERLEITDVKLEPQAATDPLPEFVHRSRS